MDSAGNLYIADTYNNRIRKVSGVSPPIIETISTFPTTSVGSSAEIQNVLIQTTATETITSISVPLSQGGNQEFSIGTITGCTIGASNPSGTICTVPITFTPSYPGLRQMPLQVVTGAGNGSIGLEGTGMAPEVAFTPGIITTVAGNGTAGYSGDGGPATGAELSAVTGAATDSAGNLYIADWSNHRIRKVNASTGVITTVAGNGTLGYSGDGGQATAAELCLPNGVALDSVGNLYIADWYNNRIRKVTVSTGIITTVAGIGPTNIGGGYSGDGGLATSAELDLPTNLTFDSAGNLYIADSNNHRIRKVNASTGVIATVAGNGTPGYSGDGGPATSAELNYPSDMTFDSAGNLYIADAQNERIREVNASTGVITTVAGNGTSNPGPNGLPVGGYAGDGGSATSAELSIPYGVALDGAGNLYIADEQNYRIRKVSVTTTALSFASTAVGATSSDSPQSVTVANVGNLPLDAVGPGLAITGPNFVQVAGPGTPEDCTSTFSLTPGTSCNLSISFTPQSVGTLSSSAAFTDNALNASPSALQSIALSGTATAAILTAAPAFSPPAGTYTSAQSVSISDSTAGATIYDTTDGTTPTTSSSVYSTPISVSSSETLEAIATASGYSTSAVATAAYTINLPTNPAPVIGGIAPSFTNAGGAAFTLTVNGSGFTTGSTVYWNTPALTTTYVSATQLTAQVPAADIATGGATVAITVLTPAPGGGTSGSFQFEVDSASGSTTGPTFPSTTATVAAGSSASYPVTLPSDVTSASVTCLNLPTGATCSYSSTTNVLTIATSSTTPAGTYQITVVFVETVTGTAALILLPILLLPLVMMRRKLAPRGIWFAACLGLVLMTAAAFSIGCGGGGGGGSTPGTQTYQVTSSGVVSLTVH
jgi:sugar lactone lactonase YvrE